MEGRLTQSQEAQELVALLELLDQVIPKARPTYRL